MKIQLLFFSEDSGSLMLPLAQLVDLLPDNGWYALLIGGMVAPVVGSMIAICNRSLTHRKLSAIGLFYVLALPLAVWVVIIQTENPVGVCSFIFVLPIGIVLGCTVMRPRSSNTQQRGFDVRGKDRGID